MQVAKTILEQLGGGKLIAMTGAKAFVAIENGLQFRVPRAKDGINSVAIVLTANDDYTVTYRRISRADAKRGEAVIVAEHTGIYCDMLQNNFEEATGLFARLF